MDVATFVRPEFVKTDVVATNVEELLRQMANELWKTAYVKASFEEAIVQRERKHPSGLPMNGTKIAIPHTNAEHVDRSVLFFVRLARPVEFRAMGDPATVFPVHLVSLFALKDAGGIGDLLEALISVYKDREFRETLLELPDASSVYLYLVNRLGEQAK